MIALTLPSPQAYDQLHLPSAVPSHHLPALPHARAYARLPVGPRHSPFTGHRALIAAWVTTHDKLPALCPLHSLGSSTSHQLRLMSSDTRVDGSPATATTWTCLTSPWLPRPAAQPLACVPALLCTRAVPVEASTRVAGATSARCPDLIRALTYGCRSRASSALSTSIAVRQLTPLLLFSMQADRETGACGSTALPGTLCFRLSLPLFRSCAQPYPCGLPRRLLASRSSSVRTSFEHSLDRRPPHPREPGSRWASPTSSHQQELHQPSAVVSMHHLASTLRSDCSRVLPPSYALLQRSASIVALPGHSLVAGRSAETCSSCAALFRS